MEAPRPPVTQHPLIQFDDVSVTYGRGKKATPALAPTSLRVASGDFVALVGPSGCGKSTILKIVSELLAPSTGHVFSGGRELGANPVRVGMAFQSSTLLPWKTIRANVMLPLKIVQPFRAEYRAKRNGEFRDRVDALLEHVGLIDFAEKHPFELSGGMQQRANLARALIHEPDLLLLDEPFGALDQFTREELWLTLQDLWQERRSTVLLVTHDLREAAFLANRVDRDEPPPRPHPGGPCDRLRPPAQPRHHLRGGVHEDRAGPARADRAHADGLGEGAQGRDDGSCGMNETVRRKIYSAILIVGVFVLWEAACRLFGISSLVLPKPSEIYTTFVQYAPAIAPARLPDALHDARRLRLRRRHRAVAGRPHRLLQAGVRHGLPAAGRHLVHSQGGGGADLRPVVRRRHCARDPDGDDHLHLPHRRERRDRDRHRGAGARRRDEVDEGVEARHPLERRPAARRCPTSSPR